MKLLLYILLVGLMLLGVASATSGCSAAADTGPKEGITCWLIKPAETVTGDLVTINCTKWTSPPYVESPLKGASLHITVYDENLNITENSYAEMSGGRYSFTPNDAGKYLIQIGAYSANFTVDENPIVDSGLITGAVVAVNTPPATQTIEFQGTNSTAQETPVINKATPSFNNFLNVVMNCTDTEKTKKDVPSFMLLIVGLLI